MIEKYQLLQTICLIVTLSTGVITAFSGFGWNYYSRKIAELKSIEQKKATEKTTNQILDSIKVGSEKVIDVIKTIPNMDDKAPKKKKEVTNIDAPNAQIVTSNQTGGTNTVINNNLDLPLPTITFGEWTIRNQIVDKIPKRPIGPPRDTIDVKTTYNVDSLFFNVISVNYASEINRNQIGLRIHKDDIVVGQLMKSGMLMFKSGFTPDKKFVFVIQQPGSGVYTMKLYSKTEINDPRQIIDYLK